MLMHVAALLVDWHLPVVLLVSTSSIVVVVRSRTNNKFE
jgi:hypothetical protein